MKRPAQALGDAIAIAIAVLALIVITVWTADGLARAGHFPPFVDWFNYRNAVDRVSSGLPLFDPRQFSGPYLMPDMTLTGYTYPPSSVVAFVPIAGDGPGLGLWLILNFGAFFSGIWAALRRDLTTRTPLAFALVLLGLSVTFLPFVSGAVSANANLAIVGLYAWCWALGRNEAWLGLFIGLAATAKVFPIALPFGRWAGRGVNHRSRRAGGRSAVAALTSVARHRGLARLLQRVLNAQFSCDFPRLSLPCALEPIIGLTGAKMASIAVAVSSSSPLRSFEATASPSSCLEAR